jgi:hypothetical protein
MAYLLNSTVSPRPYLLRCNDVWDAEAIPS